jgi:outer membrane protein OmpA-like peptidoglycan-associated protein
VSDADYERKPIALATGDAHRVKLPPRVLRGRLTGFLFDTDKTFLLPSAVPGIKALKGFHDAHPGMKVLVTGHTDTVGPAAYNLGLSDERAAAVAAYLTDAVDTWMAWYGGGAHSKAWGTREDQHMLTALPDGQPPYFAGPVTGVLDGATQAAVKRFQTDHGLTVDGVPGPETRRALVTDYMAIDGTTLPAGTELATHGCGEHHPAVPTADETDEAENRRVEVFLFEGPIEPPPKQPCPHPGCAEYPEWLRRTVMTIDLSSPLLEVIRVLVVDRGNQPLANVPCEIVVDGSAVFAGRTGGDGFATTGPLPPAKACVVRWTDRLDAADGELMFREEIMLRFDDGDAGIEQRLHNLGYRRPPAPADAVRAFQRDNGMPETGVTADVADAVRLAHDQNQPAPRSVEKEAFTMQAKQED